MATKKTNAAEAEGRASTVDTPKTPELLFDLFQHFF